MVAAVTLLEGEALFGRVNEHEAVETARRELHKRGFVDLGTASAAWKNGKWIVTFPDFESAVYVSRLGELGGIGG